MQIHSRCRSSAVDGEARLLIALPPLPTAQSGRHRRPERCVKGEVAPLLVIRRVDANGYVGRQSIYSLGILVNYVSRCRLRINSPCFDS